MSVYNPAPNHKIRGPDDCFCDWTSSEAITLSRHPSSINFTRNLEDITPTTNFTCTGAISIYDVLQADMCLKPGPFGLEPKNLLTGLQWLV